jgi:hypothetical protein
VKALVASLVVSAAACASSGLHAEFAGRTEPLAPGAAEYCEHCPGELVSVSLHGRDVVLVLDLEAVCYNKPHDVRIRGAEGEAHALLTYAGKSVEGRDGVVHIEACDVEHVVGQIRVEFEDGSRVEGDLNVTITKQSGGYM